MVAEPIKNPVEAFVNRPNWPPVAFSSWYSRISFGKRKNTSVGTSVRERKYDASIAKMTDRANGANEVRGRPGQEEHR